MAAEMHKITPTRTPLYNEISTTMIENPTFNHLVSDRIPSSISVKA
jgi:hypothetical protein